MVKVELVRDDQDDIRSFRVEGHSGYADHGQDIVCAGISAIAQTALMGLLHYLSREPEWKREAGVLTCSLAAELGDEDRLRAQIILGTMEIGLREIQQEYSDFIELKVRR